MMFCYRRVQFGVKGLSLGSGGLGFIGLVGLRVIQGLRIAQGRGTASSRSQPDSSLAQSSASLHVESSSWTTTCLLGGSWDLGSKVISTFIGAITIVIVT